MTPLLWSLIALQIVMGAFDTFYHHELTERLAWRPSQRYELKLHGVRNLLYALLFLVLGWLEVYGILAMLVIAVLVVEIVITLMDFVEEDLSRKLPASERINHTLLAINYGAILILLLPVLGEWAARPTGAALCYAGLLSVAATACAIGAALFGVRDFAAARRLARLTSVPARELVEKMPPHQTVLVTGATGFIGSRLAAALSGAGHHVIALVRNPAKAEMLPPPITMITGLDQLPDETRHRRHRQSCGRADRQRPLDGREAPPHPRLPHQHDRRCHPLDRAADAQARGAGLGLRDWLVRPVAGSGADRIRQVACLLQP
jgi:hypothetical protein